MLETSLPPRPRRTASLPAAGVFFALGVALVLACNNGNDEEDDNQFREDVIWCEEAVARLERCCPGFDAAKVECQFYFSYNEGCGTATTRRVNPALTTDESRCIRDTSCDALVAQGVCARAEQGGAARSSETTTDLASSSSGSSGLLGGTSSSSSGSSSSSPSRAPVCP